MKIYLLLVLSVLALSGCAQMSSDDCDLRTIPTTNNPDVIPQHSGLPGMRM